MAQQEEYLSEGFALRDDLDADNALEQIKNLKADIKQKHEFAEQRIQQIQQWEESEVEKLESKVEWCEQALQSYFMKLREDNPQLKTHSLPYGKLQMRKQRPLYKYDDEKLLSFLKENNVNAIRVKEAPDKLALKKITKQAGNKLVIEDTGQFVEGVMLEDRPESFYVKVKED